MNIEVEGNEEESTLIYLESSIEEQLRSEKRQGSLALNHNQEPSLLVEQLSNEDELVIFFRDQKDNPNACAAAALATAMITAAVVTITAAATLHAKGNRLTSKEQISLGDTDTKHLSINDLLEVRKRCL